MEPDRCRSVVQPVIGELLAQQHDPIPDRGRDLVGDTLRGPRQRLERYVTSGRMAATQVIKQPGADPMLSTELRHVQRRHIRIDNRTTNTHRNTP